MFGKRYVASIAFAGAVLVSGFSLQEPTRGVLSGVGLALLSVLPVFWYESYKGHKESETELREIYVSLGEEMKLNRMTIREPLAETGGVLLTGLQGSAWDSLLGNGKIAKLSEGDRERLRILYREVAIMNQLVGIYRTLIMTPTESYIELRAEPGHKPETIHVPDPKAIKELGQSIISNSVRISNEIDKIVEDWIQRRLLTSKGNGVAT